MERDTLERPEAVGRGARCTLTWAPASEETRSVSFRDEAGNHVTHVSRGMVWTCGTAVMEADSAVHFETERRVELLGDVRYRDSIRVLNSERLDYFQVEDRVLATRNVRLTRLGSGSTLEGPRVEFIRAVSGVAERTVATGRPHMVLRSEADPEALPFEVDADRTVFAGEERATAWGDVVIERPDLLATADSAFFDLEQGSGVLHGSPTARGERFELEGDTLRIRFREGALEEIWALGTGRAAGEAFEVLAERIQIRMEGEEVDAVWAHGGERTMATSAPYRLYGDSLRFYLTAGRLDTIVSVANAAAVEVMEEDQIASGGPADPREVGVEETAEGTEAEDRPEQTEAAEEAPPRVIPPPRLTVEGREGWVAGDTVWALFEPVPLNGTENATPDTTGEATVPTLRPEGDGERDARLERLRAVGNARAFYTAVRDPDHGDIPSRNYLLGREIEVIFREGRTDRVVGRDAIGIYLDPMEEGAAPPAPPVIPEGSDAPEEGEEEVPEDEEREADAGSIEEEP